MKLRITRISFVTLLSLGMLATVFVGCGKNATEPVITQRNANASDDNDVGQAVAALFNSTMVKVESSKRLFGINGGINYNVSRPVEWRELTTPSLGYRMEWSGQYYNRLLQGTDQDVVRFDYGVPSSVSYRPAKIETGLYRYGVLSIDRRSGLPDSLRILPMLYDLKELNLMYANNGQDYSKLVGGGTALTAVTIRIEFGIGGGGNGTGVGQIVQSAVLEAGVTFEEVSSQMGNYRSKFRIDAQYPYYNPLLNRNDFSFKTMACVIDVNQFGRGTGTVWMDGVERVRYFFEGKQYDYFGSFQVAGDGFTEYRTIQN